MCFQICLFQGAGKTTTFNMLTGDITPTFGTAYLKGYNVRTQLREVGHLLTRNETGLCLCFVCLLCCHCWCSNVITCGVIWCRDYGAAPRLERGCEFNPWRAATLHSNGPWRKETLACLVFDTECIHAFAVLTLCIQISFFFFFFQVQQRIGYCPQVSVAFVGQTFTSAGDLL